MNRNQGARDDVYRLYATNIRKEYLHIPDNLYYAGRRKVLENYLEMEHIYKTEYFQDKYEKQSRLNIAAEIKSLY